MKTKGDMLRFAIAFVLRSVRLGLTEEARYQVADDTIKEIQRQAARLYLGGAGIGSQWLG